MAVKITLAALKALAEEMNEVMGLDPEIDVDEYDDLDELQDRVVDETLDENDECQIYESDFIDGKTADKAGEAKFSKKAWAVLSALEVEPVEEEDEPEPGKPPKKKAETKKETPAKKPKSKPKKKETPAKKETTDKADEAKKETTDKADETKKEKKVRYTRFDSFAAALKSGIKNVEKITEKANALYVKQGGKDNVKESKWAVNVSIQILVKLEIATVEKGMLKTDF